MEKEDFEELAELMAAVIKEGKTVKEEAVTLRSRFTEMRYCFKGEAIDPLLDQLHRLI